MTDFYQLAPAWSCAQQNLAGVKVNRLRAGETGLGYLNSSEKQFPGVPHHTFDTEGPEDPKELIKELAAKGIKADETHMGSVQDIRYISPIRTETASSCPRTRASLWGCRCRAKHSTRTRANYYLYSHCGTQRIICGKMMHKARPITCKPMNGIADHQISRVVMPRRGPTAPAR